MLGSLRKETRRDDTRRHETILDNTRHTIFDYTIYLLDFMRGQRKQEPFEGAVIGETTAITRRITRTSPKHAGRPADFLAIIFLNKGI